MGSFLPIRTADRVPTYDVGGSQDNHVMPLIAFRAGERLESWSMTAEAWLDLKRSYRTAGLTMSCGEEAVPKTSTIGTQFFAHKSGTDCRRYEGGPESREHIAAKIAVAEAARSIDWDAIIEAAAPDRSWIADVLVTNGARTIAIEVQWATQNLADFERRHERYVAAGVERLWLTTAANARESARTVPHLVLGDDRSALGLWIPGIAASELRALEACVQAVLREEIQPNAEFIATDIVVATQMSKCWNCMSG